MDIEVTTHRVNMSTDEVRTAYESITRTCQRFRDQIRRIIVRVSDINGPKGGIDKRAVVQIALSNGGSITTTGFHSKNGPAIGGALDNARSKLRKIYGQRSRKTAA